MNYNPQPIDIDITHHWRYIFPDISGFYDNIKEMMNPKLVSFNLFFCLEIELTIEFIIRGGYRSRFYRDVGVYSHSSWRMSVSSYPHLIDSTKEKRNTFCSFPPLRGWVIDWIETSTKYQSLSICTGDRNYVFFHPSGP